jgi:hypothetical protein
MSGPRGSLLCNCWRQPVASHVWVLKQPPKCAAQEADAARQQLASTREKSLATEQQLLGAAAVACSVVAVLTEMYLCNVCSFQEINVDTLRPRPGTLREAALTQGGVSRLLPPDACLRAICALSAVSA